MFFKRERTAIKYAALGVTLASVPGLNYVVAGVAAALFESSSSQFEAVLAVCVFSTAILWSPAVVLLPYALSCLMLSLAIDLWEWYCSKESDPALAYA